MAFTTSIDPNSRTITITGTGPSDLQGVMDAVQLLITEAAQHPDYAILADNRQLDYEPAITEVIGIARAMFEQRRELLSRKMALVVRRGTQEQLARVFTAMANYFGMNVDVFTDADEAAAWLRSAQESSA